MPVLNTLRFARRDTRQLINSARGKTAVYRKRGGMWGQLWGAMIWGPRGAPTVPFAGPFGLAGVALALLAIGYYVISGRRSGRSLSALCAVLLALAPITAWAVPFVFSNGTIANAGDVNANFADLEGRILRLTASSVSSVTNVAPNQATTLLLGAHLLCALTEVSVIPSSTGSLTDTCRVSPLGADWELRAATKLGHTVTCSAICLN
jgi:hypothetical protein